MGKAIAVHSYKGGTGKTLIAANLAAICAKKGYNVCLLDFDFRAPSLQILFKSTPKHWLNDFLDGHCDVWEAMEQVNCGTKGRFMVGYANPSTRAMRKMMTKDRTGEMTALQRILSARTTIYRDLKIDYLFFDTSPGMVYSSVNALAAADAVLLVMKVDEFDVEGTREMIQGIYDTLGRKTAIILNKVDCNETPSCKIGTEECVHREENLANSLEELLGCPVLAMVPCYRDILLAGGKIIHAIDKPQHHMIKTLSAALEKLDSLT
jgi:chromosome partitioning protein